MKVERLKYYPEAEKIFSHEVFTPEDNAFVMDQLKAERVQLWRVNDVIHVITRVEKEGDKNVFVFVACERVKGQSGGNPLEALSWFINLARKEAFKHVRVHTKKPGIKTILERYGFKEAESIYIKEL